MSPRKVWAVAKKELRQASRDPLSLVLLVGVPTMMLVLYGFALNFDVRHVRLAVIDLDKTAASRDLIAAFVNSTYFDFVADLPADADLTRLTQAREARAVLTIPQGFSRTLAGGRTAPVQLILDGADASAARTVLEYAQALVADHNAAIRRDIIGGGLPETSAIDSQPRVFYNPELKSTQFLVPGLIGFILMLTAVLSTALSVVREKERGTMEQLRVTSLKPAELVMGKTLPYLCISFTATVIILAAARLLFDVSVRGPYLDLAAATLVYLIGALGFGLLVSSASDSQAGAFQAGTVMSMLPAIFLSGFIFPIRSMPFPLQIVTYAVPARYFNVILRGIILKGSGLGPFRDEMLFLVLYAVIVMSIAFVRVARRES
jgi:ABC-2 type transport system permease protein